MNSTNVCLIENSDTEINNLAQSIFIVLSFCSVISNVVICSDKLLENNKNFKKINSTYNILKEYFFNNYKEDKDGNIIIENDLIINKPIIPNSIEIEKEIKEIINYKSPPVSFKSDKVKKEINDFLNDSDTEDINKKLEIKNDNNNDNDKFKNKNIFKDNIFKDDILNDNNIIKDKNNIQIKHKKKESNSNKNIDKNEKRKNKDKNKL
jgi:hypothetical protein